MLFAVNHGIFVITDLVNVFLGLFTPMLIIKITEFSWNFTLLKHAGEQNQQPFIMAIIFIKIHYRRFCILNLWLNLNVQ